MPGPNTLDTKMISGKCAEISNDASITVVCLLRPNKVCTRAGLISYNKIQTQ